VSERRTEAKRSGARQAGRKRGTETSRIIEQQARARRRQAHKQARPTTREVLTICARSCASCTMRTATLTSATRRSSAILRGTSNNNIQRKTGRRANPAQSCFQRAARRQGEANGARSRFEVDHVVAVRLCMYGTHERLMSHRTQMRRKPARERRERTIVSVAYRRRIRAPRAAAAASVAAARAR
jgi:hypothetical protein